MYTDQQLTDQQPTIDYNTTLQKFVYWGMKMLFKQEIHFLNKTLLLRKKPIYICTLGMQNVVLSRM